MCIISKANYFRMCNGVSSVLSVAELVKIFIINNWQNVWKIQHRFTMGQNIRSW